MAIVTVDRRAHRIVAGPEIATRGWIGPPEAGAVLGELEDRVRKAVDKALGEDADLKQVEKAVRRAAGGFVSEKTRRRPMIVPVVLDASSSR